jgi:putative hydrolase of the HAD superfamily
MRDGIKTVFFDIGNTLLFPNRDRILAPLHSRGVRPTDEHWRKLEAATKNELDDILAHTGHADHSFWFMFYTHLLGELAVTDDSVRERLVDATRTSANWDVMRPGTSEALAAIGRRYQRAVISNADGKIAELLGAVGIAHHFQTITDSGIVGCEKPDPVIFEAALRSMNARPEESLYVGDVYSVDYLGATAAGMRGVLFDVPGAYRDRDVPRVATHQELQAYLES